MKCFAYSCLGLVVIWVALILTRSNDGGVSNLIRVPHDGSSSNSNLPVQKMESNSNKTISLHTSLNEEERQRIIEREEDEEWFQAFQDYLFESRDSSSKLPKQKIETEQKLLTRKKWIDDFPYEMEFHPSISYSESAFELPDIQIPRPHFADFLANAKNNGAELLYEFGGAAEAYNAALLKYKREYEVALFPAVKARGMVANHVMLKSFYSSELRYTEEFEKLYNIINEYGYADNTLMVVSAFDGLLQHHYALSHNPDDMWNNSMSWGDRTKITDQYIMAALYRSKYSFLHGEQRPSKNEAEEMSFRIKNEILKGNISNKDFRLPINPEFRHQLKEGDPLIYK